ncbi:hypothetical protein Clacol_007080 [Clathrus columnatus]|uniref:Cytochrome P450 n=1 Tax=Clathrus columnatus TaxID=1419009 RepID=A0AAV5ALN9_9AGAM|nr:hypothetical protein Clacol_007080 [Clathrus columnatus]
MTIPILLLLGTLAWGFRKLFIVPSNLAHIPRVSILSLLWSYISKEPESERIQRLFLPLANESGHPIILVWTFGLWIIHVLDFKIGETALRDRRWVRQLPPQDLLIWRLVGRSNLAFTIGETWRKHSKAVTTAFQGPPPIESIVRSSKELFTVLGEGGTFKWNDLTLRVTLDILGDAILGHQFKAVLQPHSPFVNGYHDTMESFGQLIREKEKKKGPDVISRMLECEDLTFDDVLDNVSVLFVAGHDTAAGALSSLIYYLAKYPTYQNQARDEAKKVIQNSDTLDQEMLTKMPFGLACVQETMRMNNSSNFTLPREADTPMMLGKYHIPPKTMMCFNISGIHHLENTWRDHNTYNPTRFLSPGSGDDKSSFPIAPFGLGLRQCPARHFAMWELRGILAMLLVNYRWRLVEGSIHSEVVQNGFSFGTNLNLPRDLDIVFEKL